MFIHVHYNMKHGKVLWLNGSQLHQIEWVPTESVRNFGYDHNDEFLIPKFTFMNQVEWSVPVVTYLEIQRNISWITSSTSFINTIFSFCWTSFHAHPLQLNLLECMQWHLRLIEAWPTDVLIYLFCCPPSEPRLRTVAGFSYRMTFF